MPAAFRQQRQRRTLIFSLLLWLLTLKSLVPLILAADEIVATAGADGSGGGGLGVSSTTVFGKFKIVRERDERRREEQRRRASAVSVPHLQQHQQQFHSDPCLLRCKDDYLNKLDGDATSARSYMSHSSPEAGIIHPPLENLLEIIRLGEDRKNVVRRLDEQCLALEHFLECLSRCNSLEGGKILIDGQEILKTICVEFRENTEFVGHVLPCITKKGHEIVARCIDQWAQVEKLVMDVIRNGRLDGNQKYFSELCRRLTEFDECQLREVAFSCTTESMYFPSKLNAKSSLALLNMLMKWTGIEALPEDDGECTWWQPKYIDEKIMSSSKGESRLYCSKTLAIITLFLAVSFVLSIIFN